MLPFAALIPVVSWVCLNATTGVLLLVPFPYRWYFLPTILLPAKISYSTIQYLSFPPGLSELWGTISFIGLIHFSSLLYIRKWSLRVAPGSKEASKSTRKWLNRGLLTLMYKVASNPRFVRFSYKDVVLPEQASRSASQVKFVVTHKKFAKTKILWLLVRVGIYTASSHLAMSKFLGTINTDDFVPVKSKPLLRPSLHEMSATISKRELIMRIWFATNSIYAPILLLDSIHTTLAIFFIYVIRVDIPEDWPDLFGSPLEAFTLGRFWSRFWHRVHLSGYSEYANLLLNLLPSILTRNEMIRKMIMTFLLFLISGFVHHLTSLQLNPECSHDLADVRFFCVNGVAVVLESALLCCIPLYPLAKDDEQGRDKGYSAGRQLRAQSIRLLGYLWVVGFFTWVIPKFYYPKVYCALSQHHGSRT